MKKIILLSIISFVFYTKTNAQNTSQFDQASIENDTVKNKRGEILQEVIVTSSIQKQPVSIGKSSINPMDLPQATTTISAKTLENQQVNNLTDILKNSNGVYIMGTTGGYQEEIASRGFSLSSSNTFKNGIRYFNGMPLETSGIEKAELLKGSSAILYGNVAAGGILNLVTKKPKFNFGSEASIKTGSFNTFKPTFDVYGSLNESKKIAFRLNGSFENADSFRNYVSSERFYVNPSFLVKINSKTELLVEADYTKDSRTPDFGAGIINYEIVAIPRDRFLGVSWGKYKSQQVFASATLTHNLSDKWNINFLSGMRYYDTQLFSNTRPNSGSNGTVQTNGDWTRSIQKNEAKDNYFIQQFDVKGKFNTGKLEHQFLIGLDNELFKTYTTAYSNFSNYDTINIFEAYQPQNEPTIPTLAKNTLTTAPIYRSGVYVQDLIHFSEKWKLLTGIRYSYQETQSDVYTYSNQTTANTTNYDGAFSPRVGLIFKPSNNHSVFVSYSNSFDINSGQDENGKALKPSIVDQYEIGIKNKLFNERIHLNITAYQITNDAFYQQSLANGNTYSYIKVLAGEVQSQGVEIDVVSSPLKGLSILAGYSFNETKFTDSDYYISGSLLRYNPKNTANLSANYNFEKGILKGLQLGVINTYFGERYAGRSTRTQIDNDARKLIYVKDFFQVDSTISYQFKSVTLRAKMSNLFNELSYNVHDDNSLNPIAPRNYSVSLNYTF